MFTLMASHIDARPKFKNFNFSSSGYTVIPTAKSDNDRGRCNILLPGGC
jgi:hypothetical protein